MSIEVHHKKKIRWPFKIQRPEKAIALFVLIFVIFLPFWMYVFWFFRGKTPLNVVILDKTVISRKGHEHASFNWLLTHYKYAARGNRLYSVSRDYFGFFPLDEEKFELKGMEIYSDQQVDSIAAANEMCYITDTYGVYKNEWYLDRDQLERSGIIYGGMSMKDIRLLRNFKEQKKLIITEFNAIASPTSGTVRREFEQMFGLRWSGWVGRYYDVLDTTLNKELPKWLTRNYKAQHGNRWPFTKSGIVFVNEGDHVEVLEAGTHLVEDVPYIYTSLVNQERFNLPGKQKYPYWFDIMLTTPSNNVVSFYSINTNEKGDSIMRAYGILKQFPAVTEHYGEDYKFYYFSGDFADNPISQVPARFRGVRFFRKYLYNADFKGDREEFFWEYYSPLVRKILQRYRPLR